MADTFIKIASVTVGSGGASSIDFTSIPSTYTDLTVLYSVRYNGSSPQDVYITFNSNTSSYSRKLLYTNNGTSVASFGDSTRIASVVAGTSYTANTFSNDVLYIPNYAGSNNKSYFVDNVVENNATATFMNMTALLWSNASAITSIAISPLSGSFVQYSTATLYGIKNS